MSEEWYPGQAYVHKHNANIRRAEERAMARNQDYKTDLYADLRDFDKAVEYVRACAIEGALDIALRDVLAANKLPVPGLGSGALRERLIALQLEHETKYENRPSGAWLWNCSCGASDQPDSWEGCHKRTREHWADVVLAALSLSSPIEPPSLTFDEWWKRSGLLGNGPMKPVAMAAWNARKASSEVREAAPTIIGALQADLLNARDNVCRAEAQQRKMPYDHDNNNSLDCYRAWAKRLQQALDAVSALPPSRQGAGGK